jgi:hypothetical protein
MTHPIFARLDAQMQQVEGELQNLRNSHALSEALKVNHADLYDEWTHRAALAEGIRSVYGGLESIMKAIADEIDGYEAPQSESWHEKLIDQMSVPIENTRDAMLSPNTRSLLHELRKFRHVLHHNYAQNLEMSKVLENYQRLMLSFPAFKGDYIRLSEALQKTAQSGLGGGPK